MDDEGRLLDPFAEMGLSATAAEEKMKVHAKEKKKAPQMDWMKKYELFSNFWDVPLRGQFKHQRTEIWPLRTPPRGRDCVMGQCYYTDDVSSQRKNNNSPIEQKICLFCFSWNQMWQKETFVTKGNLQWIWLFKPLKRLFTGLLSKCLMTAKTVHLETLPIHVLLSDGKQIFTNLPKSSPLSVFNRPILPEPTDSFQTNVGGSYFLYLKKKKVYTNKQYPIIMDCI